MLRTLSTLLVLTSALVTGQRPPFAGSRPIGFPELLNRTTTLSPSDLGDRFGEGTTQRLPIEANGDRDLIDRLSKLPIDKQPFWFINWQALEEHRKNPQSYPQRPNLFAEATPQNAGGGFSSNQGFANNQGLTNNNQGFVNTNQGFASNSQGFSNNQGLSNSNSGFSNLQPGSPSSNEFVNSNNRLSNPNSGFTNSINGFVLTDPALVHSNSENLNSNFGIQNSGHSNQAFAGTSSRPLTHKQTFTIPNQGLSTINQGFANQNQGFVTPQSQGFPVPNKGFSTSSGFSTNVALSNSNPSINSRFSASSTSNSSSSNNTVGNANHYSYNWNKTFNNTYKYTYNYTTHSSFHVPQDPRPIHDNQEYHNFN